MSIAPPRKKSRAVFWITTILIGSAIVGTVLLANDKRNLRALVQRYHITWFDRWLASERPPVQKPVVALKTKPRLPAIPRQVRLPDHAFDPALPSLQPSFVRSWRISGEALCARLAEIGLPVSKWKQSGFDTGTFECTYESEQGKGNDTASFFVIVRGTPSGELTNVRLKVILPDTQPGKAFRDKFIETVTMLVRESQWQDFETALDPIGRLENVSLSAFGSKLVFAHEFEDPRRFNFIFGLERDTPQERRTADYFDPQKWLPLPEPAAPNKSG